MADIDPIYLFIGVFVLGLIAGYGHRARISHRRRRRAT